MGLLFTIIIGLQTSAAIRYAKNPNMKSMVLVSEKHPTRHLVYLAKLFLVPTLLSIFERTIGLKITRPRRDTNQVDDMYFDYRTGTHIYDVLQ